MVLPLLVPPYDLRFLQFDAVQNKNIYLFISSTYIYNDASLIVKSKKLKPLVDLAVQMHRYGTFLSLS